MIKRRNRKYKNRLLVLKNRQIQNFFEFLKMKNMINVNRNIIDYIVDQIYLKREFVIQIINLRKLY